MASEYLWQERYRQAMLELDSDKLRQRITIALETIATRIEETEDGNRALSTDERTALGDAQQNLRALLRTIDRSGCHGKSERSAD